MADPFTPEQLEALGSLVEKQIGPAVNNMFTARLGTVEKKLTKQLEETASSFTKTLEEKLAAFKPGDKDPEPTGKGRKDVELESLRKSMQEMQQQLQQQTEIANTAMQKTRQSALHSSVIDTLGTIGRIEGTPAKMALAALSAMGRIGYDDEGDNPDKIVFRGDDGITVDLAVGLKSWLKTDEGKFFQPPSGVRGSGGRPTGLAPNGTGQLNETQKLAYLNELLDQKLE